MDMNTSLNRRTALGMAAGALILESGMARAADPPRGPLVVELFTSQGCSSCPPADRLLGELATRADIVALSFHVNYWDQLGWKDPFASEGTTARQHGYARSQARSQIYTPQMMVNGVVHSPGSTRDSLTELLAAGAKANPLRLQPVLSAAPDNGAVLALPAFADARDDHDIWLVTYDSNHVTEVLRGENRGARLVNRNVVRGIERLTTWRGGAQSWTLPPNERSRAVLVQRRDFGPIIGAARLERGESS